MYAYLVDDLGADPNRDIGGWHDLGVHLSNSRELSLHKQPGQQLFRPIGNRITYDSGLLSDLLSRGSSSGDSVQLRRRQRRSKRVLNQGGLTTTISLHIRMKLRETHLVDNLGRNPNLGRRYKLSLGVRLDLDLSGSSGKSLLLHVCDRLEL